MLEACWPLAESKRWEVGAGCVSLALLGALLVPAEKAWKVLSGAEAAVAAAAAAALPRVVGPPLLDEATTWVICVWEALEEDVRCCKVGTACEV